MKSELNLKKFLILLLGLIVLFIPTYIAIANYQKNKQTEQKPDQVTVLTIRDPEGKEYKATSKEDPDGIFAMFSSMLEKATAISALPDNIAGNPFLLASFRTDDEDPREYKYYFSTNKSECYCKDPDGKVFKLQATSASEFLGSQYSIYLYEEAKPPVLTVASGSVIAPSDLIWNYLAAGNTYQKITDSSSEVSNLTYNVGNDLGLAFSQEPDSCVIKAYNGSELLYECSYRNLPSIDLKRTANLTFVINAEWYRIEGCSAFGQATYKFTADFTAPAEFRINSTKIYHGEFFVISGVNVDDTSKIAFTSSPSLNCEPVFFRDGEYVTAFVPVSYGTVTGSYKFTVTYGLATTDFNVTVDDYRYGYKDSSYEITANMIKNYYSEANVGTYDKLVSDICRNSETLKYFSGPFTDYQKANTIQTKGSYIRLGFGRNVQLKNAPGRSFEHTGVDFEVPANVNVPAMNAGKVVYSGTNEVLGTFVVIDHGLGLKSWYAHLSSSAVKVGDIVTKDQSIGKTGKSGFTLDSRLHVGITIYDVPVAPYSLWETGVVLPIFD